MKRLLLAVVLCGLSVGCSSDGEAPESACPAPTPGQVLEECRDFGVNEGPFEAMANACVDRGDALPRAAARAPTLGCRAVRRQSQWTYA